MTEPKIKIVLEPHVALGLETAVAETRGQEFSGFGWVRLEGSTILVYDFAVLNVGSTGYTEIPAEAVLALSQREDAPNMKCWLHRHPIGSGVPGPWNWSGTDENTIQTAPLGGIPELVRWSCSIVRTPFGWVGRVDNHRKKTTAHVFVEPSVPRDLFDHLHDLYHQYMFRSQRFFQPSWSREPDADDADGQMAFPGFEGALQPYDRFSDPLTAEEESEIWEDEEDLDEWVYGSAAPLDDWLDRRAHNQGYSAIEE